MFQLVHHKLKFKILKIKLWIIFLNTLRGGGGGENIDVTSLINKDNLVSIAGYIYRDGKPGFYVKLSELNSSNNFSNVNENRDIQPTNLEVKFKNISFVIRPLENSSVIMGFNKSLESIIMSENDIRISIFDYTDGKEEETILGTYYYDNNIESIS